MHNNFDWINEYYSWLKNGFAAAELINGWTEIATPFMDRHNDGMTVYAKKDGNNITLSDDGYIINDLLADGITLGQKKKKSLLDHYLAAYGVKCENNELKMTTTVASYPVDMHMFIQAMLAVNDMFILSDTTVKTLFLEDVATYLDNHDIVYTRNFLAKGSTGLEFNFNFQIAGKSSEILINSFNSINRGNLASFLFDWLDIRDARQKQAKKAVRGLAIINDLKKDVDPQFLKALSLKQTDYILFSQRDDDGNKRKLKAA